MERIFARTCGLLVSMLVTFSSCQQFNLPSSPSQSPRLQVDGAGSIYVSARSQLYRLNSNLEQEEIRGLASEAVNISLSTDGRWLVVCLTDLSCEVYNATNLSAEPVFRRENVTRSPENVALFAAEDSFYVGSISVDGLGAQQQIILGQYGFAGSRNGTVESGTYGISRSEFERNFYGGFVRGSNAYYFATDNRPLVGDVRSIKVMRVCHNSDFGALYELSLGCGGAAPSSDSRISGVSVVEGLAGMAGTTVILSRNRPGSSQNFVCLYSLQTIDNMMQAKFNTCSRAEVGTNEVIDLAWRNPSINVFCDAFQVNSYNCTLPLLWFTQLHSLLKIPATLSLILLWHWMILRTWNLLETTRSTLVYQTKTSSQHQLQLLWNHFPLYS